MSFATKKLVANIIFQLQKLIVNDNFSSWVQIFLSVPKSCHKITFFYRDFFHHVNTHSWMIIMEFRIVVV